MSTEQATAEASKTTTYPDFLQYKTISFDCFGTLVDWEVGISKFLDLVIHDTTETPKPTLASLLAEYCKIEHELEVADPTRKYRDIVSKVYQTIAANHGITLNDNQSLGYACYIGRWGLFKDTYASLVRLKDMGYKLAILSNVDNISIAESIHNNWDITPFDAVYTAEMIGSYKPDERNFQYLLRHAPGLEPEDGAEWEKRKAGLLHVAQSRLHDHAPCKKMGISSVWINRPAAVMGVEKEDGDEGKYGYMAEFPGLKEFVDEVQRQKHEKEGWEPELTEAEKQYNADMEKYKDVPKYEINITDEDMEKALKAEKEGSKERSWFEIGEIEKKRVQQEIEKDIATGVLKLHEPEDCGFVPEEDDYPVILEDPKTEDTEEKK